MKRAPAPRGCQDAGITQPRDHSLADRCKCALKFSVLASAVVGFLCAYAFAHPSIATMRRLNRATDDYGVKEALAETITGKARGV